MSEKFCQVLQLNPTFFFTDIAKTKQQAQDQKSFAKTFFADFAQRIQNNPPSAVKLEILHIFCLFSPLFPWTNAAVLTIENVCAEMHSFQAD